MARRNTAPVKILIIEDNPGDAALFDAFFQNRNRAEFHMVSDGEEALDYLCRRGNYRLAPRPDLIIMDINMPKIDGKDVLREIKRDAVLQAIPVIVLTSSENEEDVYNSYASGASCVLIKAADVDQASKLFELIEAFWVNHVRLPKTSNRLTTQTPELCAKAF